ncbi:MAG: hypothetical protein KKC75_06235 [Nanoarchaeota archaeon]|nr:hypothetical protein [Nanoarchaeota archaeon]MBU1004268.1 hypothetical protein [Nanoarchaeota archaeon]MBU1946145.1 hypothetical protein [Nanoarchaeota archaeon]
MKKRGMIEVNFNWIFILIAGAVIFVFFINIVNKQRQFSEIKTSGSIVTNLESILTGAQVSTGTVNIIDLPKVDIGFECDRYFIGPVPKQTRGNVIFAPNLLKGKQMITWTLDWNLPYRVTNILYITDPELRYIIVYDSNTEALAKKLDDELPKEMNKELVDKTKLGNLGDKNNYQVRFIFLAGVTLDATAANGLTNLAKMRDEDVTAINLTEPGTSNILSNTGTIKFLQKQGNIWVEKGTTYYLKKETFFGAIFAADLETYNCVMKKAFKKLNLVTKVYTQRSTELRTYYGFTNTCFSPHDTARLVNMEQYSQTQSDDFPNDLAAINAIQTTYTSIKDQNQRAQLFSCALIY